MLRTSFHFTSRATTTTLLLYVLFYTQALAKLTDLLERQMNRLEEKESEQRRAMSKSYKQNVKLSGDIYRLTTDNKHRVSGSVFFTFKRSYLKLDPSVTPQHIVLHCSIFA